MGDQHAAGNLLQVIFRRPDDFGEGSAGGGQADDIGGMVEAAVQDLSRRPAPSMPSWQVPRLSRKGATQWPTNQERKKATAAVTACP
jgi:hypothetical protein